MNPLLLHLGEDQFKFNTSSKGGLYQLRSPSKYRNYEDAKRLRDSILLNYQISEALLDLRKAKGSNEIVAKGNHLDLLLAELRKVIDGVEG